MNLCDQLRETILTQYVDGELDATTRGSVESHLANCSACREFAQEVQANLIRPFHQLSPEPVPDHLWDSIRGRIEEQNVVHNPLVDWLDRFLGMITFPKLVPALTTLILTIFIASTMVHNHQIKLSQEKARGEYLISVLDVNSPQGESGELETPIEQYFL